MASQSPIAEGSSVVTPDHINYHQKMPSHPQYRFDPQFVNNFVQPIMLGAFQTSQTINLPPEVFNLSQSYLMYTVNLPPGAAHTYIWYAQQASKEISHFQLYCGTSTWIVDLDNVRNYLDIVSKKELVEQEFTSASTINGFS